MYIGRTNQSREPISLTVISYVLRHIGYHHEAFSDYVYQHGFRQATLASCSVESHDAVTKMTIENKQVS